MILMIVAWVIIEYADIFIIEIIAVFFIVLAISNYPIIAYKRKIKMYKRYICDEYGLDIRLFDAVQIAQLGRDTNCSELANKIAFEPQHWLYSCKDGSRDLRYTKSNKLVPDNWTVIVKAQDMYYLLTSNNEANIEQIMYKISETLTKKQ